MTVMKQCLAVAAWAALIGHAHAQTLSGSYMVNFTSTCPSSVLGIADDATGDLQSLEVTFAGSVTTIIGVATFYPAQNEVSFVGQTTTSGTFQFTDPTHGANPLNPTTSATSINSQYSNTATTILLPIFALSPDPNYTAFYTTPTKSAIARAVTFSNLSNYGGAPNTCVQSGTLNSR